MRILTKTQTLIVFDLEMDNCDGMTVADLKLKLQNFPGIELLADEQCLRYHGIFLNDDMLLNDILGEKREIFYLTRLNSNNEPNDEDGAVGGQSIIRKTTTTTLGIPTSIPQQETIQIPTKIVTTTTKITDEVDKCSILTESDFKNLTNIPGLDLSTVDDGDLNKNNNNNNDNNEDNDVNVDNDDDEENVGVSDVFDEDMELPPDLQQYYIRNINVDKDLVNKLVAMGYIENDVNNALQASFNDPERAVEYLIDGIPNSMFLNSTQNVSNMDSSRTPPPSYAGSICSDYSMAPMPPSPHSPDVSANSSSNLFSCKCQITNHIENESEAFKNAKNENNINTNTNTNTNNNNNNNNNNNKNINNTSSESERQGYDANDEAEAPNFQLGKRKRKMPCKFKKRRIEVWAAKATLATVTRNHHHSYTQNNTMQQLINTDNNVENDEDKNQKEVDEKAEKELIKQMNFATINDVSVTVPVSLPKPIPMDTEESTTADASTTEDANTAGGDHNEQTNSKV